LDAQSARHINGAVVNEYVNDIAEKIYDTRFYNQNKTIDRQSQRHLRSVWIGKRWE